MSPETQRKIGLPDSAVDFDELMQLDDSDPKKAILIKKLKAKRLSDKAVKGLRDVV
jgi:hypothetical protein